MRHHHNMRRNLFGGLIAAAMLLSGTQAMAAFNAGARAGFSSDPDQFVIGGQAVIGSVAPFIQLAPSLDLGFGNDISVTALNIDLQYNFPSLPKVSPNIYVGAGPSIVIADSDTEVGVSLVAGLRIPMAGISYYNFETRFGLDNVPDLKVLLGIMFGL